MSFGDQDAPGWTGLKRSDGLTLRLSQINQGWQVLTHDARPDVHECYCCHRPLATARAAQLVANAIYPIQEPK